MKMLLSTVALMAMPLLADSIPSGWMVVKDRTNACQIATPGDFKRDQVFVSLAKGPGDTMEVQVFSSNNPIKPLKDAIAKAMGVDKMFENTPERVFYANKPGKVADGRIITGMTVTVPRGTGTCFASITLTPAGSEDLAKKIGATIGPAK